MKLSNETNHVFAAMVAVQAELEAAPKDSVNPHFKSRYADLASCVSVSRPVLAKHKLAVMQFVLTDPERDLIGVMTVVAHQSGQWISGEVWCKPRSMSAQDVGAAITYLRRYGYATTLGLISEEDDDGNKASQPRLQSRPPVKAPIKPAGPGYDPKNKDMSSWLLEQLKHQGVPDKFWPEVEDKMVGRQSADLTRVIAEVRGNL